MNLGPQSLLRPENAPLLLAVAAWTIAWKGVALWHAARRGEKPWFVALLIVNTVGILEILYLYVFSRTKKPTTEQPKPQM